MVRGVVVVEVKQMTGECGCGVVNRDSTGKCRACGTPMGMVWTPHGFQAADDPVDLSDTPRRKQRYGYGWFCVVGGVIGLLIGVSEYNLAMILLMGLLISAAALGRPWGWYVLLGSHVMLTLFLFGVGIDAAARGEWTWVKIYVIPLAVILPSLIYFYNRRVMFGAQGRWRWFERFGAGILELGEETPPERKVNRSGLLGALATWGVIFVVGFAIS